MKKKLASLFSVVVIAVGIGACATEAPGDDGENLGQVRQPLCKGLKPCGGFGGGLASSSGGVLDDPDPPTFTCPVRRPDDAPCGPVLRQIDGAWKCVESCVGGPFVIHAANPCGFLYPNYTCAPWGACTCTR